MRGLREILLGEATATRSLYNLTVVAARDRSKPLLRPRPLTHLRTCTHAGDSWPLRFAGFLTAFGPSSWHHSERDLFVPVLTVGGEIWRAQLTTCAESALPRGGPTGLDAWLIADLEQDYLPHWYPSSTCCTATPPDHRAPDRSRGSRPTGLLARRPTKDPRNDGKCDTYHSQWFVGLCSAAT